MPIVEKNNKLVEITNLQLTDYLGQGFYLVREEEKEIFNYEKAYDELKQSYDELKNKYNILFATLNGKKK